MRPVTIARFVCLFTLLSLVPLGLALAGGEPRDGESYRVLAAHVEGVAAPALGLTYDGALGRNTLVGELILVLASCAVAVIGRSVAQRVSLAVLCMWAMLWTFNAGHVAVVTGFIGFWGAFALTGLWLTLSLLWFAHACLPSEALETSRVSLA